MKPGEVNTFIKRKRKKMINNNIRSKKEDFNDSYWLDYQAELPNILPIDGIESEYIEDIVNAILKEFVHTNDELKKKCKKTLEDWLIEMSNSEVRIDEDRQVQTLIYEMF